MVAFSMYRGNLHRVPPNPPRQWPMPPQAISPHQFRRLMEKRSQALSRLPAAGGLETDEEELKHEEGVGDNGCPPSDPAAVEPQIASQAKVQEEGEGEGAAVGSQESQAAVGDSAPEIPNEAEEDANMEPEVIDMDIDTHKERTELKKKLKSLNEKKHNYVQMLKMILNAEEEIKRRSIQSPAVHPCPLQVETAADMGSVTRHTQKITVEVNFGSDMGGEQEAAANHNVLPCSLQPMQIISPSATSHLRTNHGPQHNMVPNNHHVPLQGQTTPSGVTGTASSSPFRIGPKTHQGNATSMSAVSVPGTNYCPSTPSPAGLGGATSAFKDPHHTSSLRK